MYDEHYAVSFCPAHSVRPTPLGIVLRNFTKWPPLPATMDNRRRQSIFFNVGTRRRTRRRTRPHAALCVATSPHHAPPVYARQWFGCSRITPLRLRVSSVLYVVYLLCSAIEYLYPDITVNVRNGNFVNDENRKRIPIQR